MAVAGAGALIMAAAVSVAVGYRPATQKETAAGMLPGDAAATVRQPAPDRALEWRAMRPVNAVLKAADGDTVMDLLLRAGAGRDDANAAVAALRRIYDPRTLQVGQKVDVELGPLLPALSARPLRSVGLAPEPGRRIVVRRSAAGFAAAANRLPTIREYLHYAGTIKTSLFESAVEAGVPPQALAEAIAAYSYDVDFQRDLQPGDGFELMISRTHDSEGEVMRAGELVFADLVLSGKHLPIYRYVDNTGQADFYTAKGESVRKALLRTPVDGARITSGYGMRLHPILGYTTMHKGVDFGAPPGTHIMAAGDGVVTMAGYRGNYGVYLRVKHNATYSTAYAHMDAIAAGIHVGSHVRQGQLIGYVGATGLATGPHLYYEVLVNDRQVNPMGVKFKSGNVLAGRELARFRSMLAEDEQRLAEIPVSTQLALAPKAE